MTRTTGLEIDHVGLQATVVAALHVLGWEHLHVRRSIGKGHRWTTTTSQVGWPDLYAWHPRAGRQLAVELKVPPDRLTDDQHRVLGSLADAGVEVAVLCPDDLAHLGELLAPNSPPLTRTRVRTALLPRGRAEL